MPKLEWTLMIVLEAPLVSYLRTATSKFTLKVPPLEGSQTLKWGEIDSGREKSCPWMAM